MEGVSNLSVCGGGGVKQQGTLKIVEFCLQAFW